MFNTKQLFKRAKSAALATSLIAIQILSPVSTFLILNHTAPALAADTAVLTPNGQGNYTAWDNGEATVDETDGPSCSIDDSIIEDTSNNRESVNLDLSSVTDGSTVSSVTVYAWDRGHNDTTGGTYRPLCELMEQIRMQQATWQQQRRHRALVLKGLKRLILQIS